MSGRVDRRPYRFDDLGWLQFERLCLEILAMFSGVAIGEWRRSGYDCAAVVPGGVAPPGGVRALAGPTLVLVAWIRGTESPIAPDERLEVVLEHALADWSEREPRSVLVLTNVDSPELSLPGVDVVVLGARELSEFVAESWPLRLRDADGARSRRGRRSRRP